MKKIALILLTACLLWAWAVQVRAEEAAPYRGPLIALDFRGVDLKDALRALGREYGFNIIVNEEVRGVVTVGMKGIPLWDAVDSILRSNGYSYRVVGGNLIVIMPISDSERQGIGMEVREFKLNFINVEDPSMKSIEKLLGTGGEIIAMKATNSLIIRDTPESLYRISEIIQRLDRKRPQIMIEARMVEVSKTHRDEFGIQWSYAETSGDSTYDAAVNLPVISGEGPAGLIGVGVIKEKSTLDVRLQALEDMGNGKILSSPKIMVLENQEAMIASGMQIIIPNTSGTTSTTGVTTQSTSIAKEDATLNLTVTPRTVSDDQISLTISTRKEEFDFGRSVLGVPPKNTREAKTELIVRNGETVVIGGIYSKTQSEIEHGVPYLSKIPFLGWLFKRKETREDQVELLIFITPTKVEELQAYGSSKP